MRRISRISRKLRQATANILDLPQDVVFDLPRITMIGNVQAYVENHRGVLHFSSDTLRLALTQGQLEIHGADLIIRAIMPQEVFIEGKIHEVKYING